LRLDWRNWTRRSRPEFSDARRNLEALQVEKSTLERILEAGKDKKGGGVIPPS
jgi:hypothetical protein